MSAYKFAKELGLDQDDPAVAKRLREVEQNRELAKTSKDADVLHRLSNDQDTETRHNVVSNPATQQHTFHNIIDNNEPSKDIKDSIAKSTRDPDLLHKLAQDPTMGRRVSANTATREATLRYIIEKRKPGDDVKEIIASRSKDPELLHKIAQDHMHDYVISWNVASNPHTSSETLDVLSDHTRKQVRRRVIEHKKVSDNALYKLIQDREPMVSKNAFLEAKRRGLDLSHLSNLDKVRQLINRFRVRKSREI
jgi:hypothetical protein